MRIRNNPEILDALERVRARNRKRRLVPEEVIVAAREESNPLHGMFTWEDGVAAEQWRLFEARKIIQAVVTVLQLPKHLRTPIRGRVSPPEVRHFVSLRRDRAGGGGGGYRTMADVMSASDLREELLAEALRELKTFREKYGTLKELASVFEAAEKVEEKIGREEKVHA